jgi:carbon monoxide dehydrogenase subunit G
MKVEGSYVFEAPLATVWQALFEPEILAKTLPGCERLERNGNQFIGEINVKMGPVQGKFQGKVDIADVKELSSYSMVIDGRGPAGFVKATPHIKLQAEGAHTRMHYDSDVQVGGKVASVGQRLLDASSRAIVKQSLEGLHEQIKGLAARHATAAAPAPAAVPAVVSVAAAVSVAVAAAAPEAASASAASAGAAAPTGAARPAPAPAASSAASANGPSQAAFAFGVAKEVTKELFPIRTVLLILGAVILAWVVYRNFASG